MRTSGYFTGLVKKIVVFSMTFQHNHLCYHTVNLMFPRKACAKSRFFFKTIDLSEELAILQHITIFKCTLQKLLGFLTGFS